MIKDKEKNIIIRTKKPNNLLGSFSKLFYSKYLLYCLVNKNIYVSYANHLLAHYISFYCL